MSLLLFAILALILLELSRPGTTVTIFGLALAIILFGIAEHM